MFTRKQAIRWAELWLACWNEGDYDTLLALHRDAVRFTRSRFEVDGGRTEAGRIEELKRHWAAIPYGIHSMRGRLERVAWDPDTRELTIVYATDVDGMRGCDLVTLDADARVVAGEPCVGSLVDIQDEDTQQLLVDSVTH